MNLSLFALWASSESSLIASLSVRLHCPSEGVAEFDCISQGYGGLRFGFPTGFRRSHRFCNCRDHSSSETANAEAGLHILHLE